jgi:cyclic beta-1,2-glucan synthetase
VARVILNDEGEGTLAEQLGHFFQQPVWLPAFTPTPGVPVPIERPTPPVVQPNDLRFDNGFGGFSPDGREYVIHLEPGERTPAPWINVIANPQFGFFISESGASCTWAANSGENRLTPWSNDQVRDGQGEAIYLRDEENAEVWSPTPLPLAAATRYVVRHGAGYTTFEHTSHELAQHVRVYAASDAPVKIMQLRLHNTADRPRRITATYYAEWVLGTTTDAMRPFIVPEFDADHQTLLARNAYNAEFGERVAFVTASVPLHGLTADRAEFLGRRGSLRAPAALGRIGLAGTVRAALDPCAALQIHIDLQPGETQQVHFVIGQGASRDEAIQLAQQFADPAQAEQAWQQSMQRWDDLLGTVTVQTPDPAMDTLLNRWLMYQSLSCRVWGRTAFYQSSGAFGYRDQLQDVMAYVHTAPELTRAHILEAAQHQFEAGDVLHWWHPPSGRGIRSRCSDDLLWLPYVTAHYIEATNDLSILDEHAPFLKGEPLRPEEEERYGHFATTPETYPLYEHCRRALRRCYAVGPHGLPLIGSGDWNDGMNRVGIEGEGESVWMAWFVYATLMRFARVCERTGDTQQADAYREQARTIQQVAENTAWDGAWYRRAYYDDGTPLGSASNIECKIDSIAQSWAVLSGAGDPQRVTQAMQSVNKMLVRRDDRLILLFTPPFDKTTRDPGYIRGYVPGIRENGGQYTHAAIWATWAFAQLGQGEQATELFSLLNPINHSDKPEEAQQYVVEPYVVAADIYGVPPHTGRGGWTWYTGSASWMYRLGLEAILGVYRTGGDQLRIDPRIPKAWESFQVNYRYKRSSYHIRVLNEGRVEHGVAEVNLDGRDLPDKLIPLVDDGASHEVVVKMGN